MDFVWIKGKGPGYAHACSIRQTVFVDEQGFYEKAGFAATGAATANEGVPHMEMERAL